MTTKAKKLCPLCKSVVKGHPNKKFCNSQCKDRYHNIMNPRGFYARDEEGERVDDEGPGWDAHKAYSVGY